MSEKTNCGESVSKTKLTLFFFKYKLLPIKTNKRNERRNDSNCTQSEIDFISEIKNRIDHIIKKSLQKV